MPLSGREPERSAFDLTTRVVAAPSQASCDLDGDAVILNLSSGTYHGLNEVGTRVWHLLEEPRTVGWIRDRLVEEYDVDPDVCLRDLCALLEALRAAELVEVSDGEEG